MAWFDSLLGSLGFKYRNERKQSPQFRQLMKASTGSPSQVTINGNVTLEAQPSDPATSTADVSKYQAVFLADGEIYFGKLKLRAGQAFAELTDVYYLQNIESDGLNLVKLGYEAHGPEDSMMIATSQIMFWENLRTDSLVVMAIKEFQDHAKTQ